MYVEPAQSLVAFWHIGFATPWHSKSCETRNAIVEEQYLAILQSPMYQKRGLKVHFVTPERCMTPGSCVPPADLIRRLASTPHFRHVRRASALACADGYVEHFEVPTLVALHAHCRANPKATVAYFHTKGEDLWRRQMMEALLGMSGEVDCMQRCFSDPQSVACGSRLELGAEGPVRYSHAARLVLPVEQRPFICPAPAASWCHFSGNFWWARCSHVAQLNVPVSAGLYEPYDPNETNVKDHFQVTANPRLNPKPKLK